MVLIPEGSYEMGSQKSLREFNPNEIFNPDRHMLGPEDPAHTVWISAFYIDIYEVTNQDYKEYVDATKAKEPRFWDNPDFNQPRQPVVGVSWYEAADYCKWKNKRLPTEAEWEKASRGKRSIIYPWGNEAPDSKKLNFNSEHKKTLPVGSFEAGKSDYGVYDLSGNVAEWVSDWHMADFYVFSPDKDPTGPKKRQYKVVRGGHWMSTPDVVNMTYRNASMPKYRGKLNGFRCALEAETEASDNEKDVH